MAPRSKPPIRSRLPFRPCASTAFRQNRRRPLRSYAPGHDLRHPGLVGHRRPLLEARITLAAFCNTHDARARPWALDPRSSGDASPHPVTFADSVPSEEECATAASQREPSEDDPRGSKDRSQGPGRASWHAWIPLLLWAFGHVPCRARPATKGWSPFAADVRAPGSAVSSASERRSFTRHPAKDDAFSGAARAFHRTQAS